MKILSLFDGISCGYVALQRAGIPIDKYYASEIDKYAIQISKKNHPDIIHIGDVCNVDGTAYKGIDLLIGGSPCQGFSVAGKMLNFNDPRSKLFFEYVRILKECQPRYFLLENVIMKKEWQDIISSALGVQPICINSSLVSAQNRKRLYRTNIPGVSMPKDKGIILKDILEEEVDEKYYYSEERWNNLILNPHNHDFLKRLENVEGKCNTLTTVSGGNQERKIASYLVNSEGGGTLLIKQATKQGYIVAHEGDGISLAYPNSTTRRGRVIHQKSATLTTHGDEGVFINQIIRKLTPIEYERLQTLEDNYTAYYNKQIQIKNIKSLICNKVRGLNVVLNDVKENQNGNECVLCIREDLTNTEAQNYQLNHPIGMQNVNIVIEKLEKNDEVQDECVIDITKTDLDMEIPYTLTRLKRKDEKQGHTDIIERLIEEQNTSSLWRIKFEGIGINENVSIILTLLKRIIQLRIYTYVKIGLNITISIGSWRKLQQNYIESELLLSKIESIDLMSDSQRYKMLGNGWTCDVVAHIFRFIPLE